jgi:hypothetical protein
MAVYGGEIIPRGFESSSPGLRGTSYPGYAVQPFINPERVGKIARLSLLDGGTDCKSLKIKQETSKVSPTNAIAMR